MKSHGIKATVFERDPSINGPRAQGWAVSLRFALPLLQRYLDPELARRIETECAVDPSIIHRTESKFDTIDGRDLSVKFTRHTKGPHIRTNRPKLRALLANGLDIQWGKRFRSYEITPTGIVAKFDDETVAEGTLLISCEGAVSQVRSQLLGKAGDLQYLPLSATALVQTLQRSEVDRLRKIDPLMFQSINPDTNVFFWCSLQGYIPETDSYDVLAYLSHPSPGPSANATDTELLENMKNRMEGFHPMLKDIVDRTKPGSPITRIRVRDWNPVPYQSQGRVCLAGDAAGCMTMYRGEGVNHGILDAALLAESIRAISHKGADAETLLNAYSQEVAERRAFWTPLSRQACLDAHTLVFTSDSPLVNTNYPPPPSLAKITAIHAARRVPAA
ncbi:FAD/NAD(P)-binding domain-containing protein [Hymenopellis radicata]|nr:FAD/NAD(P)-binding domain-containing protein [Hymenopellis radicata]